MGKLKQVSTGKYRVSVSKSLNNLFAQIIDDKQKNSSFCIIDRERI